MIVIVNVVAWALLLGLPIFGHRRGSGAIICVGIYVFLFQLLAKTLAPALASSCPLVIGAGDHVNAGWWQLALFLPLLALAFPLGRYLNRVMAQSFEPFEEIVSTAIGAVVALIAVQTFLSAVVLCSVGTGMYVSIEQLFLVRQVVALESFRELRQWLTNLNSLQAIPPPQ